MELLLKKITSLCLASILSLSFSLTALADSPTQIFVDGTPGDTTIDMTTSVNNGDVVGTLETDADPGDIDFFEGFSSSAGTDFRFDVNINGDIVVARADLVSAEGARTRTYSVIADESGVGSITQIITINIAVPPVAPDFENPGNFELLRYEQQGDGSEVFYSEFINFATDQNDDDTLDTLTFTELSCTDNLAGDCSGLFSYSVEEFDNGFGAIDRVAIEQPDFDFEDRAGIDYYDVELRVTDDGGLSSTETFRIENTNLAEFENADSFNDDSDVFGIGDSIFVDLYLSDSDDLYYGNSPRDEFFNPDTAIDPILELQLDSGTADAELQILPNDTFTGGQIEFATGDDSFFAGTGPGVPITFLRFLYTVTEGDSSSDLDYSGTDAIDMGTGELLDYDFASDNFNGSYYFETGPGQPIIPLDLPEPGTTGSLSFVKDFVIDGIRPFIDNSTGSAIETNHLEGDTIEFSLDFNEDLDLSGYDYTSTIDLDIGGTIVTADDDFAITSGLAPNQIGFTYTVLAGELDLDGIDIVADSYSGGNISDLADNDILDFSHLSFNLPNDLVGEVVVPAPAPTSSGGGGGGNNATVSSPFDENEEPEIIEEEEEEEPAPIQEPEITEELEEEPTPIQEPEITEEEEEEPAPTIVPAPTPAPVVVEEVTPVEEELEEDEEPIQEPEVTEEPTEEDSEEPEINFTGSLTANNNTPSSSSSRPEVKECDEYDSSTEYTDSQSYNCDPSETFVEEEGATIQLNLPQDRQSQYNNDNFIIVGKVSDETIKNVEVIAISGGQSYILGVAAVDEAGKFLLRNNVELPENEDIVVYGRDIDTPTQSPDYGLAISNNVRLIETDLIAFAEKPVERLYESNEEGVNYWTFVSTNEINNGALSATVKTELNTEHEGFWQSVLFGSTAITGSNSDETTLFAPDETITSIQPFSKHTVTILAQKANAKSVPMVIEYYVIPSGFGAGVGILILALIFGAWYLYNKKKQINSIEADKEVVASEA